MKVGYANFKYKMLYDHAIIEGSFGNARFYDLTNYPKTRIPSQMNKGTLKDIDNL